MNQVVIENPILNSPYGEPNRHFRFTEDGITNEIIESRRISSYFVPKLLNITRRWLSECVIYKDNTFPQLLLLIEFAHKASDFIYNAIIGSEQGQKTLKPIIKPYDSIGSTRYVDFDTIKINPAPFHGVLDRVERCGINLS